MAVGAEQGGVYSRGQFLVSADGGREWSVASARAEGGDPPPGEYPRLVAGGEGAWTALGGKPAVTVSWTSRDGRAWTRQTPSRAFGPADRVSALARAHSGFVAVGTTSAPGGTQAVMWTSADGRAWTRYSADQLKPPPGGIVTGLSQVTARDDVVLAHGTLRTTVTKTDKETRKKVHTTVQSEAFWRSADGGRTWVPIAIPQAQGSRGDAVAAVATQAGFFAVREASQATGSKKHKKTEHYAVILKSADGQTWAPAGRLSTGGYARIASLSGDESGLTALVSVSGGRTTVLTSGDGVTWRPVGGLPAGPVITGAALAPQGPIVTGRQEGGDAYLTVAGAGDIRLPSVPGAVHAEVTVDGIAADGGQDVAVGSTNGRAALWTSPDGSAWTRARLPEAAPRRMTGAVKGGSGWLAVGGGGRSLAVTSADGREWRQVRAGKVFGDPASTAAAAAGDGKYVVVGRHGSAASAAYSTDLRHWASARGAGKRELDGGKSTTTWMSDVAAGPSGFVAVGGRAKGTATRPALWTSTDGRKWRLSAAVPALPQGAASGSLTGIVASGGTLVATGVAGRSSFAAASADGGRTWRPVVLPDAAQDAAITAATATSRGFVLAGTTGSDVMLWTSADGLSWRSSRPRGNGLDGPGVQRIEGLAVTGGALTAVGFSGDYRDDGPTLWRRPLP